MYVHSIYSISDRLFTYQHLPQIKFHNPAVKFMVSEDSKECVIELSNGENSNKLVSHEIFYFPGKGETNILEVEEKTHREIKVVIEELYPAIIMDSIQTDSMYNTQITQ